ncbi:hypothetical protein Smp_016540 [Schistosoma mansoni]|uniref:MutL_C domain-containing protein n=1 Tax=Schistosoma mansoni TaxID=6183 RepID=G4VHI0_SCHMA|nr:hypothetical protein Smp_016540 [Schistosoma mansoni]|eukprot:XP_018652447.1 hypothetical protein Smp_016540 [Schistosoma mansoni]
MLSRTTSYLGNDVYCLTVNSLRQAKVVGQFDKKFILLIADVRSSHYKIFEELSSKKHGYTSKHLYIIAVDQHAAHERILLECFEKECLNYFEMSPNKAIHEPQFWKMFSNKISLKLSKESVPDIFNLVNREPAKLCCLSKYGFSATLDCNSMGQFIFITMIPRVIPQNHLPEKLFSKTIISCIRVILLNKGEPNVNTIHHIIQAIHPLLESRACHQAIRFGSKLNKKQMEKLIVDLARCRIPFQCAHGRPTCTLIKMIDKEYD